MNATTRESPKDSSSGAGADLDPQIRTFVQTVSAAFARYPDFNSLPPPRRREIAEQVRAPWNVGGPGMARRSDLRVDTAAGRVRVRLHDPSSRSPKPALVYMHGGGWTLFSIDTHDRLMREYAARADVVVIGVDYALSPEVRYPTALQQVVGVVHWARANAAELGIDADRIALGGDSAGGNLTLAASLALRDAGDSNAVSAMLLNYSAIDTLCSEQMCRQYGGAGYMLTPDEMDGFWRNYVDGKTDTNDPLVCPIRADLRRLPPAFLTIAECDILAEQNVKLAARLRDAQVPVESVVYRGASHSFLEAVSISSVSNRALDDGARWLRKTLGSGSSAA